MNENAEFAEPTAEAVHRRALTIAYLTCRAMIDADPRAAENSGHVLTFIKGVGLEGSLEPAEARLLAAPHGSLSEMQQAETSWLVEGMAVLAWALGKAELPRWDEKCDPRTVSVAVGMFQPGTKETL